MLVLTMSIIRFEVPSLSHTKDMKNNPKYKTRGDLERLGHSKSSAVTSFDRAHTNSCLGLIETNCHVLYCFSDIASYLSKVANVFYPTCIWRPMQMTAFEFRWDRLTSQNYTLHHIVCAITLSNFYQSQ